MLVPLTSIVGKEILLKSINCLISSILQNIWQHLNFHLNVLDLINRVDRPESIIMTEDMMKGLSKNTVHLKGLFSQISFLSTSPLCHSKLTYTALQSTNGGILNLNNVYKVFFGQTTTLWLKCNLRSPQWTVATESLSQWVELESQIHDWIMQTIQ